MKSLTEITPIDKAATVGMILLMVLSTLGLGFLISVLLAYTIGVPQSLGLSSSGQILGGVVFLAGVAVIFDTLRYRHPGDMLASTSVTLRKLVRRTPIGDVAGRKEQFVAIGPHIFVRNPLYFGVVLLAFGLGIAFASTPLLLWGAVLVCWFWFFLIPFEERELEALFGESYSRYKRQVPKLFPYGRKYHSESQP